MSDFRRTGERQNDGLWSHGSSFLRSSAITGSSWRLTAAPLMEKHALWQMYGTVESPAKLSKNIFFMHFHHTQKRQARWEARFQGSALTLRCDGRLIEMRLQKNRAEGAFLHCLVHHPTEWFIVFQQAAKPTLAPNSPSLWEWLKQLNSPNQRGLTPFALDSSSSFLGILEFHLTSLTKEKQHGNNNWLYILLPAQKKFPPQKAETQIVCLRSFAQIAGIKNIFSCRTYANKSLYYANHVHLIFT